LPRSGSRRKSCRHRTHRIRSPALTHLQEWEWVRLKQTLPRNEAPTPRSYGHHLLI
jgi:hypothetical protein